MWYKVLRCFFFFFPSAEILDKLKFMEKSFQLKMVRIEFLAFPQHKFICSSPFSALKKASEL